MDDPRVFLLVLPLMLLTAAAYVGPLLYLILRQERRDREWRRLTRREH